MPRISESIELGTTTYVAVRPQNGTAPATFRESNTNKPLAELKSVNIGAAVEKTANQHVFRAKVSLQKPSIVEGIVFPVERIDITSRLSSRLTDAEVTELQAELVALVSSDEFVAALRGNEQY